MARQIDREGKKILMSDMQAGAAVARATDGKRRQLKVQLSDASTAASEQELVMEEIVHVPKFLQQERTIQQDEALEAKAKAAEKEKKKAEAEAMMRAWWRRNAG